MIVRCSEYKDCDNKECMHYEAHEPLRYEGERDCTSAATICFYIQKHDVICLPVEHDTVIEAELEAELVKV
ncbi:MAG: hypothetical protein MUP81_02880 [Dehalococcoidia bacterium]|nr:hypothetical protein [Dehalococcoidia bacterium]